ncbi:GL23523 [Drosophila persimilis]|uniref:GL23523 n=1 Tax=Drosophila persimilis TaxID=7234 RepID=B4G2Z1_DROPE|nr:GL23523 [Drosophila persimilis]
MVAGCWLDPSIVARRMESEATLSMYMYSRRVSRTRERGFSTPFHKSTRQLLSSRRATSMRRATASDQ